MHVKRNGLSRIGIRYAIVLSGGDGVRMRDFVYRLRGRDIPKQYVNFIGQRSMLEHTLDRAEKLIPRHRLLVVVARDHLRIADVRRQIRSRPQECIIIQPENKDTAPGILLPLLHIYKRDPDATVAVFPSDHFVLEEDVFMRHVDQAFQLVEQDDSRIVLLGMEPSEPDPGYGYIVPGENIDGSAVGARKVELFVEKPAAGTAAKIIKRGALWNTLVLVFKCKTLLQAIQLTTPALYRSFEPVLDVLGTADDRRVLEELYHQLPSLNFSRDILEVLSYQHRRGLIVLPVPGATWSDWGTADRLTRDLTQIDKLKSLRTGTEF